MKPRPTLLGAFFLLLVTILPGATTWRPVTPDDTAARPPANDPEANALVLLRETRVDSSNVSCTTFEYYYRVKVFTAAGVERLNRTEVPFARESPPRRLAARVVKPDGRTIEVARDAVFTRDILKDGGQTISVKAFSFPALEPGDIAEYSYTISSPEFVSGMRFCFEDPFPTALAKIEISMASIPDCGVQFLWSQNSHFTQLDDGRGQTTRFEAHAIPAVLPEPFPPPDDMIKPWFLYYYTLSDGTAQKYWSYTGGELQALTDDYMAPKKRIKETAAKLLAGAEGEDECIRRLYEFCRTKIKNLSFEGSGYTPDEIEKLKFNRSSTDTLNSGYATATQINMLFGALLRASGRHPYLAYCGDRSQSFFDPQLKTRTALPHIVVAIQQGLGWAFYDPGARFLPPGKLDWKNEGTTALAVANERWQFVETPRSDTAYSTTERGAELKLAEDGTLEGDLTMALAGHPAFAAYHRFAAKSATECADLIKDDLVGQYGDIEVTEAKVTMPADLREPLALSCHIRIPGYASVVGDRLIVPQAFFQKGKPAVFTASTRNVPVFFPYFLGEVDKVSIAFPEGFEMEPPGIVRPVTCGNQLNCSVQLSLADGGRRVVLQRNYLRRLEIVDRASYGTLQQIFQQVTALDSRTLSLVRKTPAGATATP